VLWDMADKSPDLTLNERRAMKGYEPVDGGDVILVQSSQITLADAVTPIPAPAPDLTPEDAKAWVYGAKAT
jgi:hypothetical protein